MTEADWLSSTDPQAMLTFLRDSDKLSQRKARLFAVACCRRVWGWLTDDRSRKAVEVAERYADARRHPATLAYVLLRSEVMAAWEDAGAAWGLVLCEPGRWAAEYSAWAASRATLPGRQAGERQAQAGLLRDIIGNPFRPPPPLDLPLLQGELGTVKRLAEAAYEERIVPSGTLDLQRLAVLADALEEAGGDPELVDHLRGPGPHVRGCHVVDTLTGRGEDTP